MHSVWFLQWKWYSCCSEIQLIIARPQSSTSKHLSKCTQFWMELSSFLTVNKECGQPQLGEGNALNLGQQNPHIGVCSISERTNIARARARAHTHTHSNGGFCTRIVLIYITTASTGTLCQLCTIVCMATKRTTNSDMQFTDMAQIKLQPFWIFNVTEISNTI